MFLEYRETHFPGLFCRKKKMEKLPIFNKNHILTPLEKSQFFDFMNFLFLSSRKVFLFFFRILQNTFSWPFLQKVKNGKISNI